VERERADRGAGLHEDRDRDLVTLEGLESELTDLDAELAQVDGTGSDGATDPAADRAVDD